MIPHLDLLITNESVMTWFLVKGYTKLLIHMAFVLESHVTSIYTHFTSIMVEPNL